MKNRKLTKKQLDILSRMSSISVERKPPKKTTRKKCHHVTDDFGHDMEVEDNPVTMSR